MRLFILALTLLLAAAATAPAQMMTPDGENGRYSSYPVADGVLRLDTRTGQMSQCSRSDVGWTCTTIPDERAALEAEIVRPAGRKRKVEEGTVGPWIAGTRSVESVRRKARRVGTQVAE